MSNPCGSVDSIQDLRTVGRWFDPRLGQYSLKIIYDIHCDGIHSSLAAVHCFEDGYERKLGKNIPLKTGKKNCMKAWTGPLAAAI